VIIAFEEVYGNDFVSFFSFHLGREPDVLWWETARMEREMLWQNDHMEHRRVKEVVCRRCEVDRSGKPEGVVASQTICQSKVAGPRRVLWLEETFEHTATEGDKRSAATQKDDWIRCWRDPALRSTRSIDGYSDI